MLRLTSDVLLCKGLSCDDNSMSPDNKSHHPSGSLPIAMVQMHKHLVASDRKKKKKKKARSAISGFLIDDGHHYMEATDDCSCFPTARK